MSKVRRLASLAKQTPIPRKKTEPPNAHHVLLAVPPKRAAPNVPIAHRANLKMLSTTKKFVLTAPWALHKVTRIETIVRNAHWAPPHWPMPGEVRCVFGAILVDLVVGMAFAKIARLGSIKIPKVKRSAVFVLFEKYPTKKVQGVNCHRGVPAK